MGVSWSLCDELLSSVSISLRAEFPGSVTGEPHTVVSLSAGAQKFLVVRLGENSFQSPSEGRERKFWKVPETPAPPNKALSRGETLSPEPHLLGLSEPYLPVGEKTSLQLPLVSYGGDGGIQLLSKHGVLPKEQWEMWASRDAHSSWIQATKRRSSCRTMKIPCSLHLNTNFFTSHLPFY